MCNYLNRYGLRLLVVWLLTVFGCASFNPRPIEEVPFKARAKTKSENNVRVTAAVLSAEESKAVFDLDLYKKGIQPIWIEIENNDEERVWFAPVGVDRDYFSPLEVAYMHHRAFSKETNYRIDKYLHEQGIRGHIEPGRVKSGFVFTCLDLGTKIVNVDLVGEDHDVRTFTFFISVPGLKVSYADVDFEKLYPKDEIVSYEDEEDLRKALEGLPCCSTNADGSEQADPLNLVVIGNGRTVHRALIRSGWDETGSTEKVVAITEQYRYTPVSPFYLYGRPQDAAFRKTRETADERNHVRFWLSPIRYKGKQVWVGQISRDIKVRYLPGIFRIEPAVDEARSYILQDLWYSQTLAKFGYVKGLGAASMSNPRNTLQDDPYFTDGYRLVIWVSRKPVSFSEVEVLEWEVRPLKKKTY
ncbi:MAG: LssY C-terminal domain-containing protein [Desulfobacteraceae bacterium]|jgi:hypothetical protein